MPFTLTTATSRYVFGIKGELKTYGVTMVRKWFWLAVFVLFLGFTAGDAFGQETGGLRGQVLDPTGAVVPGAKVTLVGGERTATGRAGADGTYVFRSLAPGDYTVTVIAQGFALARKTDVAISAGQMKTLNLPLVVSVEQTVQAEDQTAAVGMDPDQNAGAISLKGDAVDALSDNPDELQNELQALAGPGSGPNGGQIYIDGFAGGQLPPKSSIREVRINQNPFSAEFDAIGYGRVEILTKPGTDKFHGQATFLASDSAINTNNALVPNEPGYLQHFMFANLSGPMTKHSSYFFNMVQFGSGTQAAIIATNPNNLNSTIREFFSTPQSRLQVNPRFDFQLGANNTLSIRDAFTRFSQSGSGVGTLVLPGQASQRVNYENDIQVGDTQVVNQRLIAETRFQWRRIRNSSVAVIDTPAVTLEGAFTTGGNAQQTIEDHQDDFELQNYWTAMAGKHTMRFGTRLRAYRDANFANSGSNGTYTFQSPMQYEPCIAAMTAGCAPAQYQQTVVAHPLARALLFDGALFYQDDWRARPNLTVNLGLRFEGQNRIHDHADWAPRVALAWAPKYVQGKPAKTVFRAGYGWFYNRFSVPDSFTSATGTPYVIQTIHNNGINQQNYVINNPTFYDPNAPLSASALSSGGSTGIPTIDTIDPNFHAALSMQGAIGVDRQLTKKTTANVTYLYTHGIHQYLTNVVTAPAFDLQTYAPVGPVPPIYNNQFQSAGTFNESQIVTTVTTSLRKVSLNGSYTFTEAKSDTSGPMYVPSVSSNPRIDYGRASFDIHNRLFLLATYNAPWKIILAGVIIAQSGTPYNVTLGTDLTGNNQFNARPTYGQCGAAGVVTTSFGCLDANPEGKGEKLVPYDVGTGPSNFVVHFRISKAVGVGPKVKTETGGTGVNIGQGSAAGNQQKVNIDASVPRKYSLTFIAGAYNLFNIANRGTPNGVLTSPLFGQTQTLASGPFGPASPGNRTTFLQAMFSF